MGEVQVIKNVASQLTNPTQESPTARATVFHHGDLWAGYARIGPEMDSRWHHHGEHDTYFFILSDLPRRSAIPVGRFERASLRMSSRANSGAQRLRPAGGWTPRAGDVGSARRAQ